MTRLKNNACALFLINLIVSSAFSSEKVDDIIKTIYDSAPQERHLLIDQLRALGDPKAIPCFIKLVNDESPVVRRSALMGLCDMPDKSAYETIVKALSDKNKDVQEQAITALWKLRDKRSIGIFRKMFDDKPSKLRTLHAIIGLCLLQDHEYTDRILQYIQSINWKDDVSYYSYLVMDLSDINDHKVEYFLTDIFANKEYPKRLRRASSYSLTKIPFIENPDKISGVWKDEKEEKDYRIRAALLYLSKSSEYKYILEMAKWIMKNGSKDDKNEMLNSIYKKYECDNESLMNILTQAQKDPDNDVKNTAKSLINKIHERFMYD
jgi:hypothetical protein